MFGIFPLFFLLLWSLIKTNASNSTRLGTGHIGPHRVISFSLTGFILETLILDRYQLCLSGFTVQALSCRISFSMLTLSLKSMPVTTLYVKTDLLQPGIISIFSYSKNTSQRNVRGKYNAVMVIF